MCREREYASAQISVRKWELSFPCEIQFIYSRVKAGYISPFVVEKDSPEHFIFCRASIASALQVRQSFQLLNFKLQEKFLLELTMKRKDVGGVRPGMRYRNKIQYDHDSQVTLSLR